MARRLAITGVDVISPFGEGRSALWDGLQSDESVFAPTDRYATRFLSAQCGPVDMRKRFGRSQLMRAPRVSQYALAAVQGALAEAGHVIGKTVDPEQVGISYGTSNGPAAATQEIYDDILERGAGSVKPRVFQESVFNAPASLCSIQFNIKGPISVSPNGICAGGYALEQAQMMLTRHNVQVAVALSSEEICEAVQAALHKLRYFNSHPNGGLPVRPYSQSAKGALMSEGGVAVVLEPLDAALARGATVLAELKGIGCTNDAHRLAANATDGRGLVASMTAAQRDGKTQDAPDLVLSGSASTRRDDETEQNALTAMGWSDAATRQTSTRGSLGLAMGSSTLMDVAVGVECLQRQSAPRSKTEGDMRADLSVPVVTEQDTSLPMEQVMVNTIGINGLYCSALLGRAQ